MRFDREQAQFYMVVILVVIMSIIAVEIYKLQRDVSPLANSPIARALSGLGQTV